VRIKCVSFDSIDWQFEQFLFIANRIAYICRSYLDRLNALKTFQFTKKSSLCKFHSTQLPPQPILLG